MSQRGMPARLGLVVPRAALACLASLTLLSAFSGCSSSPPIQLYQLRADPPSPGTPPAPQPGAVANPVWALGPLLLPEYLDRDAIVRPSGQAALQHNPAQRWAEPLRDALPRLLAQDLARLRGTASIWRMPLPPGVKAQRQLRVEVQRLDASNDGRRLVLLARWTLVDPAGRELPQVHERRIEVDAGDGSTDALVSAHRQALWQLALAIATGA